MALTAVNEALRHVRQVALRQEAAERTDGELLKAYLRGGDEAAFEALVRRHGAMVLGVCRRVLRNDADAEDAFQATFLVLVKKAASIRSPGAVSNWLYGVAHTTALKAKAMNRKRQTREREAASIPKQQACEEVWRAVQALLDAEMASLPEKYRVPIVLCDLESSTIKDAARQLGWPQGTVATRLARGRALLARRLARHGIVVSAGTLIAALSHGAASAGVPPGLVHAAVKTAGLSAGGPLAAGLVSAKIVALSHGVMQAMFLTKLKSCVVCVAALAFLSAGIGSVCQTTAAEDSAFGPVWAQDRTQPPKQVQQNDSQADLKREVERLRRELERTQLELKRTRAQLDVFRAQAEQAKAEAELQHLRALEVLGQIKPGAGGAGPNKPANDEYRKAVEDYWRAVDLDTLRARNAQNAQNAAQNAERQRKLAADALKALGASPFDPNSAADAERLRKLAVDALKAIGAKPGDPAPAPQKSPDEFKESKKKAAPNPAPNPASALSPDQKSLAVAQGPVILVIELQTGKLLYRSEGHKAPVTGLAFTPDGKTLVSGGQDKIVRVWDAATGKEMRRLETAAPVASIRVSEDGRTLTITIDRDHGQQSFDLQSGQKLTPTPRR
jgi:RNA polymerase sigma factor (sigma-70 family)